MRYAMINKSDNKVENIIELENLSDIFFPDNILIMQYDELNPAKFQGYWLENINIFTDPQPFPSWTLNKENGKWQPPIPKPNDNAEYYWIEENQEWFFVPNSDYEVQ